MHMVGFGSHYLSLFLLNYEINLYHEETDKGHVIFYTQCKPSIFLSNILIFLEPRHQNFIGIPNHKI